MKFNEYPLIIAGSGASIPFLNNSPDPQLKKVIENNIVIGINYFDYFFTRSTITTFVDGSDTANFYKQNLDWLKKVPFIIGRYSSNLKNIIMPNTMLMPSSNRNQILWEKGIYFSKGICNNCDQMYNIKKFRKCPKCQRIIWQVQIFPNHLTGLFSLSLGIALGFKKIFLLGYDCYHINGKTHFYQELLDPEEMKRDKRFKGVGLRSANSKLIHNTNGYDNPKKLNEDEYRFGAFLGYEKRGIEIYNVSPLSIINLFPKITYNEFYNQIGKQQLNQEEIRKESWQYILDKQK